MRHVPVLLNEVIENLRLRPGDRIVDCTLGDAGHAEKILASTAPDGKLLGIDADAEAILRAKQYLYNFDDRVIFVRDNFSRLAQILTENKFAPVRGILMDLGWSAPQFMERGRGFSFDKDEPLDMRFDTFTNARTAQQVVNQYGTDDLAKIFKEYGEEKLARPIAEAIVATHTAQPIQTSRQLTEIILNVYRQKLSSKKEIPWVGGMHPATQVFQALRIEVNDELAVLKTALPQAIDALVPGGRLAVISFHSLEDRIVKQFFQKNDGKILNIVNKKPIIAASVELAANPRARSAKLRVAEKI